MDFTGKVYADAQEHCFKHIGKGDSSRWILEGDIKDASIT